MKINEMQVGKTVSSSLVLVSAAIRQTKGFPPKDYLAVEFTDGTDSLDGKMWDYSAAKGVPEIGKIYDITGSVSEYQGKKQVVLQSILVSNDQDKTKFCCTYFENLDILSDLLEERLEKIGDKKLHDITKAIYKKYWNELMKSTSAKGVHHVGIGGNVYHSIEVFDLAESIAAYYRCTRNIPVSVDLVRAGALLHDVGKPFTYEMDGPAIAYSFNGRMFDHIVNGLAIMSEASQWFDNSYNESISLLSHIIASHHGQLEFGSPVTPQFLEAYIVNFADNMSAAFDTLLTANEKATKEGKDITDKLWTLGNKEHTLQKTIAEMLGNGNSLNT